MFFLGLKRNCFTPPQIYQSYFKLIRKLCMWVNLINIAKQQTITKALGFAKNRFCHSMEIKKAAKRFSITAISSKDLIIY